jgi:hypothetical protein
MSNQSTVTPTHCCEVDAVESRVTVGGVMPFGPDSAELDQSHEAADCWTPVAMRLALADVEEET